MVVRWEIFHACDTKSNKEECGGDLVKGSLNPVGINQDLGTPRSSHRRAAKSHDIKNIYLRAIVIISEYISVMGTKLQWKFP